MANLTSLNIGVIKTVPLTTNCSLDVVCPQRGFAMDVTLAVCEYLNYNCTFEYYDGGYGSVDEGGNGTGMIGAIQRGEYDTSLPVFTPTFDRYRVISFTDIYSFRDVFVATRSPTEDHLQSWNIVRAFEWPLWILFLWSFSFTAAIILFFQRILDSEHQTGGFFYNLIETVGSLRTSKHSRKATRFDSVRLLTVVWSMTGLLFSISYTSMLFSKALLTETILPFTTLETLVDCLEEKKCQFIRNSLDDSNTQMLFTPGSPLSSRLEASLVKNPPRLADMEDIIDETLNEKNVFLVSIWEERAFYWNAKGNSECQLYTVSAPFMDIGTFPLKKGSKFHRVLSKMAAPFIENGLDHAVMRRYQEITRSCNGEEWKSSRLSRVALKGQYMLEAMAATFYFYAIGISFCVIIFVTEKYVDFMKRKDRVHVISIKSMNLKIGVIGTPPGVMPCALDPVCASRGFAFDAAELVCDQLNLTCTYEWFRTNEYGDVDENGNGSGLVGGIQWYQYDTSVPVYTPTYRRSRAITFSDIYFYFDVLFVTRLPTEDIPLINWSVINAFQWKTWCVFLAALILTSLLVSFVVRYFIKVSDLPVQILFTTFAFLISMRGHKNGKTHAISSALLILWTVGGIVVTSAYTGMLFSQKVASGTVPPFIDFETFVVCLERKKCRIIAHATSYSALQLLTTSGNELSARVEKAIRDNPILVLPLDKVPDAILKEKDTYLVWVWSESAIMYAIQGNANCSYYTVDAPYKEIYTFPLRKNSSLQAALNRMSRPFRENDLAYGLRAKYGGGSRCSGQWTLTGDGLDGHLLRSMVTVFMFFAAGSAAAALSFILEMVVGQFSEESRIGHGTNAVRTVTVQNPRQRVVAIRHF